MAFEVEKEFETFQKDWHEFKSENDKGRKADAEKLAKIEASLNRFDELNAKIAAQEKAAKERADKIEALMNRAQFGAGGEGERKAAEAKQAFDALIRRGPEALDIGKALESKTLVRSDDTAGGYLAPPEFVADLIKAEVLYSPMRDLVNVRKTSRGSVMVPKRTGTAAASWVSEQATRAESTNPTFGMVEIPTHELTAEVYVSLQELEDSVFDVEGFLADEFAEQFAVSEGLAVVSGNGVGRPFGLTDSGQGVATTNSGTATTIADASGVADGLIDLFHAVKTAYARNGSWIMNRKTLGSVRKLKDTAKRYIWEPSPAAGLPSTILGKPYTEVPDLADEAANALPIGFGDWKRAYMLVDRLAVSILRDPYTKASVGAVKFVARRRLGGQVVLAEACRFLKCSA